MKNIPCQQIGKMIFQFCKEKRKWKMYLLWNVSAWNALFPQDIRQIKEVRIIAIKSERKFFHHCTSGLSQKASKRSKVLISKKCIITYYESTKRVINYTCFEPNSFLTKTDKRKSNRPKLNYYSSFFLIWKLANSNFWIIHDVR